jgi:hypothetical protein
MQRPATRLQGRTASTHVQRVCFGADKPCHRTSGVYPVLGCAMVKVTARMDLMNSRIVVSICLPVTFFFSTFARLSRVGFRCGVASCRPEKLIPWISTDVLPVRGGFDRFVQCKILYSYTPAQLCWLIEANRHRHARAQGRKV